MAGGAGSSSAPKSAPPAGPVSGGNPPKDEAASLHTAQIYFTKLVSNQTMLESPLPDDFAAARM